MDIKLNWKVLIENTSHKSRRVVNGPKQINSIVKESRSKFTIMSFFLCFL